MSKDYNDTLNLPKTDFPMRAGLPQREPVTLKRWEDEKIYETLMKKNEGKPLYVLHDGPPFSNGDIHVGTAMNKILKDFIVRYKNMSGFKSPYVPGWDNHGMPIESAIIKKQKIDRKKLSVPEFRSQCRAFAQHFVERHREQFRRLGVVGDWDHPYLTMDPAFEAFEIRVFGKMAEKGYIYRGLKPVYWCPHDETALAEAEIEYEEDPCESIYVKFRVVDDGGRLAAIAGTSDPIYFVIWTTTTWTLPGNLAIAVNPAFEYTLVRANGEVYVMASELADGVMKVAGISEYEKLGTIPGRKLEYMKAQHPFLPRTSLLILGDHVTLDAGTGCVHTAPGHGMEDFVACREYKIDVVVPVDARGYLTGEAGPYKGLSCEQANVAILEDLKKSGALLCSQHIRHTYPHCWRCHNPVIYRATEQWFASVDSIKDETTGVVDTVRWIPGWGHDRMVSMVRERADWCISRQRNWGLPIPVFYCKQCGKPLVTQATIDAVSDLFGREGSNAWFERPASEILPAGTKCPDCGCTDFKKETDTLDGWFDSGSTHAAVLATRPELRWPADMYLEGADQYRGWFQSSLLTAVATRGAAPYKTVLTHGWTVDGEGKKMSKSLGNVVDPMEIVRDYGADILRLWVASADYTTDMRISKEMFSQISAVYLKIRNTARFILGNLRGFEPDTMTVPAESRTELDRYILHKLNGLVERTLSAYEAFQYHVVYHAVHNFCVVELSSFYLDVVKDRLYCEREDDPVRRSAQSTMYEILDALVRLLTPILAYTADEIWHAMPHRAGDEPGNALYNDMPRVCACRALPEELAWKWQRIETLREDVNGALEKARADKLIGKPLEAKIVLGGTGAAAFEAVRGLLPTVFIVSQVEFSGAADGESSPHFEGLTIRVEKAGGEKCARCWTYSDTVGRDAAHPDLCERCARVVKSLRA